MYHKRHMHARQPATAPRQRWQLAGGLWHTARGLFHGYAVGESTYTSKRGRQGEQGRVARRTNICLCLVLLITFWHCRTDAVLSIYDIVRQSWALTGPRCPHPRSLTLSTRSAERSACDYLPLAEPSLCSSTYRWPHSPTSKDQLCAWLSLLPLFPSLSTPQTRPCGKP